MASPGSPTGPGSVLRGSGTVQRGNGQNVQPTRKEFEVLIAKQLNAQQEQIREAFKDMVALITDTHTAQEALKALKDPIKKDSALVQLKGLSLLGALVKNCTHELPAALATKKWMDRLLKLLRTSRDDRVKKKILQLLVDWDNQFKGQAQVQEFSIAIARLRAKNVELPPPTEKIEHRKPRRPKPAGAESGPAGSRSRAAAPTAEQSAVMGTVELLVMNAHADMSNLEIGLQRPEMLQEGIAEECRGHLRKIQNLLSADLPDAVTYELIVISDSLKELLGLFDALYTDSAPEEIKAEREANEMMKIEQEIEAEQAKRNKRERELEQLKEQLAKERETLKAAKAAKEKERANRPLNTNEKRMEEAVSSTISKAAGVKDMARDVKRLLREHRESLVQANSGFNADLAKGLYAYPEHVEKAKTGETKAFTTLKRLYTEECATRKKLYNKLQELRGNIRVYCRVRPMNTREKERGDEGCVSFPNDGEIVVKEGGKQRMYEFDICFPSDTTQEAVFEDTKPLINCVIDGYKVCIFAYGQTGSGKTHTMTGPRDNPGINRRAVARLFELVEERRDVEDSKVQISVLEIYNERIHDLLNDSPGDKAYEIKTHPQDGQYVQNLLAFDVHSLDQIDGHVAKAEKNRTQGKTNMNEHSSRSHMLLYIVVRTRNLQSNVTTVGKLALVDLAGSERVNKSGATGDRMKEAQAINKSLSALGDVISSLSQNNSHVPYRNSKLTHLLQDSLGGSAKCLMFVNVSPASSNANESNNSLAFAFRARGVVLGPAKRNVQQEKE